METWMDFLDPDGGSFPSAASVLLFLDARNDDGRRDRDELPPILLKLFGGPLKAAFRRT
jgi:hypothetical protein